MPKTMLTNGSVECVAARMPNLDKRGDMHDVLKRSQDLSEWQVSKPSASALMLPRERDHPLQIKTPVVAFWRCKEVGDDPGFVHYQTHWHPTILGRQFAGSSLRPCSMVWHSAHPDSMTYLPNLTIIHLEYSFWKDGGLRRNKVDGHPDCVSGQTSQRA